MRVYSGYIDARVEGLRAGDAFVMLEKDIMRVLAPFLAAEEYRNPRLFGSIVRGNDTPFSDIDMLLSRGPKYNEDSAFNLYRALINAINFPLDIVVDNFLPSYIDISYAQSICCALARNEKNVKS